MNQEDHLLSDLIFFSSSGGLKVSTPPQRNQKLTLGCVSEPPTAGCVTSLGLLCLSVPDLPVPFDGDVTVQVMKPPEGKRVLGIVPAM